MADYSVQAYLERQSSDVLLAILKAWIVTGQWRSYDHAIPLIMAIFDQRHTQIPEEILAFVKNTGKPARTPKCSQQKNLRVFHFLYKI